MKPILIGVILASCVYAQTPSSVIIDGVEYIPAPSKNESNATETYTIPKSSLQGMEDCWYEEVVITEPAEPAVNYGGAVLGGIIGGVIGHQFGRGSGNTAATIGGAALGTALGANATTKPVHRTRTVRKCNTLK